MFLHAFDNEVTMIFAWSVFVRQYDPDDLYGYNHINFDLPLHFGPYQGAQGAIRRRCVRHEFVA